MREKKISDFALRTIKKNAGHNENNEYEPTNGTKYVEIP